VNINSYSFPAPKARGNYSTVHDEHVAVLQQLLSRVRGDVGRAKRKIQAYGWARHVSPFWELLWMRPSFYRCFGICLLHLEYLGLAKVLLSDVYLLSLFFNVFLVHQRHLLYTCIKYDLEVELNKRFMSFTPFPGISFPSRLRILRRKENVHRPYTFDTPSSLC
jgi:hypothetical protein